MLVFPTIELHVLFAHSNCLSPKFGKYIFGPLIMKLEQPALRQLFTCLIAYLTQDVIMIPEKLTNQNAQGNRDSRETLS